ncbi:MAG: MFS transporter [Candidatus Nealsonbacteria bacterium]|nr:MFS transporter [Candidatus Nealsonbacteria bacterium]
MLKSLSKVVKVMVLSDFFLMFGWGLVFPILAIFVTENIEGGDATVVGIAFGIYWILKSVAQIPIGSYLDRNHGDKDDFYFLIGGTFLSSLTAFGLLFSSQPWHIYGLQVVNALGAAMALPAWSGIFTRHIGRNQEAQSWALDSSALGLGAGIAGVLGGFIAKLWGFTPLFLTVGALGILATAVAFLIKNDLTDKKEKTILIPKPK